MIEGHVLLLNGGTWEPLTVVSIPRAINLLLAGKAIVVEDSGRLFRTVRDKFPVPSVIPLRHFINVPRRHAHWSRQGVLVRDNYACISGGATLGMVVRGKTMNKRELTVDHILPGSRGRKNTWSNTACACFACNHRKGNRLPGEAGLRMLWEPKTPRTSYLVIEMGSGPATWKRYIEIGNDR